MSQDLEERATGYNNSCLSSYLIGAIKVHVRFNVVVRRSLACIFFFFLFFAEKIEQEKGKTSL